MSPRRNQHGQTALLIVGFFLVAVLLVGVVVDASAAYLRRQSLNSLADGAALAAADGARASGVYAAGLGGAAEVDEEIARRYAAEYLAESQAGRRYPGLTYRVDAVGDSVVVRLVAPLRLPIPPPGFTRPPQVSGEASAVVLVD
ncbi:MAG: hypothetical protein GEU93_21360 [Propionibacteriales bacterium]|nr:hypothetical protein [Propionibacteriales bacterium]